MAEDEQHGDEDREVDLAGAVEDADPGELEDAERGGLSRRGFLAATAGGVGLSAVLTAGSTVRPLAWVSRLAVRVPHVGPQGLPVNTTAKHAGVTRAALDPTWRLTVRGKVRTRLSLDLGELRTMEQHEVELPIACVEGWSSSARWRGVRLRDLVERAGGDLKGARVVSLQRHSIYSHSEVDRAHLNDPLTLVALELNGEVLDVDHGYPARLISPDRPGVMQTKWLSEVVVR